MAAHLGPRCTSGQYFSWINYDLLWTCQELLDLCIEGLPNQPALITTLALHHEWTRLLARWSWLLRQTDTTTNVISDVNQLHGGWDPLFFVWDVVAGEGDVWALWVANTRNTIVPTCVTAHRTAWGGASQRSFPHGCYSCHQAGQVENVPRCWFSNCTSHTRGTSWEWKPDRQAWNRFLEKYPGTSETQQKLGAARKIG